MTDRDQCDEIACILIMDDDEGTRSTLARTLEQEGYQAVTAATDHEGLEKASRCPWLFNLALLDVRPPDLQGVEMIAPLRELNPDMAVIIATGYASLATAMQATNDSAIAYLTKPLRMEQVLATIRAALEKQRLAWENRRLLQAVQQELAERVLLEQALRDELDESRRRQAEIAALQASARAVLESHTFAQAARLIFDSCKQLTGATAGCVALLSADGCEDEVLFLDPGGLDCPADPALPMPIRGLWAEAFRNGRAVYHNEVAAGEWAELMPAGHVGLDNVLFAPLVLEGRVVGLVRLANKPGGFTVRDVEMTSALADQVAIALRDRRTQERLAESEQRFRAIVETAGDAVITADSQGNTVSWNRAAEAMFGYPAAEAVGRPLTHIMPAQHRWAHGEAIGGLAAGGKAANLPNPVEVSGLRSDGREFPLELSVSTYQVKGQQFHTAIVRDVSERVQARAALRQSESRYRDLFDQVPVSLWEEDFSAVKTYLDALRERGVEDLRAHFESDPAEVAHCASLARVLDVNQYTLDLYGARSKEELVGNLGQVLGPEAHQAFKEELLALAQSPSGYSTEIVNRTLPGDPIHVSLGVSVAPGAQDTWSRVLVSIVDITGRVRLERENERRRLYLESMMAGANDAIVTLDNQHRVQEWNPGAERLFGYSAAEAAGRELDSLITGGNAETAHEAAGLTQQALDGQEIPPTEVVRCRRDGTPVSALLSGSALRIGDQVVGAMAIYTDITGRRQAEKVQSAVYRIAQAAFTADANEVFYHSIHSILGELMPVGSFYIALYDPASDLLSFPYDVDQFDQPTLPRKPGRGLTEYVLRTGRPLHATREVFGQLVRQGEVELVGTDSMDWLGVPLKAGMQIIGMMATQSYTEGIHFSQKDLELLDFVSMQVAEAIRRRHAEEALAGERVLLRTVIDHLPDAVYVKDAATRKTLTNRADLENVGATSEAEILGKTDWEVFPEDVAARCSADDQAVLQTGQPVLNRDELLVNVHGQRRWLLTSKLPLRDESGRIIGLVGIGHDITERKQAEQELRDLTVTLEERVRQRTYEMQVLHELTQQIGYTRNYEELFHLILEHLHRVVEYDVAGSLLVTNQVAEIYLRTAGPIAPAVVEEVKERLLNVYERMTGARPALGAVIHKSAEPSAGDPQSPVDQVLSFFQVPVLVGGQVQGVIFVGAQREQEFGENHVRLFYTLANQAGDSVQRLRALLAQEKQRLESLVESLPEGVMLLDAGLNILLVNPAGHRHEMALGVASPGEPLTHLGGRPIAELLTSPPRGLWHEVTVPGPTPQTFELISQPIETGPENQGWVLVIREVTQEREIQQRVAQQERLAAVGQLAAGIAHDFNNIMAVIILYAQMMLRSSDLAPADKDRLRTMSDQARQATNLIQQILDFSRTAVLERQPLDLLPFAKEFVKLLRRTLPESIDVQLTHSPADYTIEADPTRVQQLLMNLSVNARDAMPEGGRLHLALERLEVEQAKQAPLPEMAAGEWIRLSVSDNGTGIPADVLPRIFEPFFTTKEVSKGTGLGLAQVYGIVKQHGGHIGVTTQMGQGTTFAIYLPALPAAESQAAEAASVGLVTGQGETVLLVEDNPATRRALVMALEMLNYRALVAENGWEALSILERRGDEIDLVVSDLVMPGMGGRALVHALQQQGSRAKVVFLSGYPAGEQAREIEEEGGLAGLDTMVAGWLQKPVQLERLAQVVAEAVRSLG